MSVKPYSPDGSKREQVERMFDAIAPRYDLLNRVFSLGVDRAWRRRVLRILRREPVDRLLDLATGTADLALLCARHARSVVGADISEGMLSHGRTKVDRAGLADRVELVRAASESLPFPDAHFDAVTVAFGVRNFDDLDRGLREMRRVLRPGGRVFVLEFSRARGLMGALFRLYFHRVMPMVGRWVSGDSSAYTYLPRSVEAFPEGPAFEQRLRASGFSAVTSDRLSGGIATLYIARS
ncbi:MAG TPA: bifunctional demethylmenaquinone methyltransferase/2-methoxy-6-polyprenyl-1,4-benzoquinol methylase UbiE [Flavobacteriales bacterium]|nr:bifunctional demethylmenaquinone methyltransferase/2-methoxy-6-polyprenyl-1,4-benzoquinol methylase UbiE [Flavobacteriales bacterium]HMR28594.1 bifunctional demethylmenaquinone methyltransferase/2-methoxy-6-polyprenyl-1,4-benzoquinol methylase UbiE [Flavobacteriales bacterium]